MKKTLFLYLTALVLSVSGCKTNSWVITSAQSTQIAIDKSLDTLADSSYISYLQPFKQQVDATMKTVVGVATETMSVGKPESLLSNLSADIYLKAGTEYMKTPVDMAIVNRGGLRTVIPAGNITVGKVFELMPFENELVILWLKGDKINDLCQYFASIGGEGVAGLRMTISNEKATDITIAGKPLDMNKTYSIATNDYLAGGNDKMVQLAMFEKRTNTGIKIRDMLMDYIKNETAHGREISSKLDGRIK